MDAASVKQTQQLLGIGDIRKEFSVGRELATRLAELLPHLTAGRVGLGARRLVQRVDMEQVVARAISERIDLWELVRKEDAREILADWLTPLRKN